MSVFAIGDLHLPGHDTKPMDIFGDHWDHHFDAISEAWRSMITEDDLVLIPGDISWAMHMKDAMDDFLAIDQLPGKKVITRGNHDYWWSSLTKLRQILPPGIRAVQNDACLIDGHTVCGTRGWTFPSEGVQFTEQDQKIWSRELIRMRMALDAAAKLGGKDIIVMLHYPPVGPSGEDTDMSRLIAEYPVSYVVYGHLHGNGIKTAFIGNKNGAEYHLVSCDALGFKPKFIAE